jgi:hypothetical protein
MPLNSLIGSLTASYTAAEYAAGKTPLLGQVFEDIKAGKRYIFLKNTGATSITAGQIAIATATGWASFFCQVSTGNSNVEKFAGSRVLSATAVAQNEYGWFQVGGSASLIADAAGTAADKVVVPSNATAGAIEDAETLNTGVATAAAFGVAQTTTTGGAVIVQLNRNFWGV